MKLTTVLAITLVMTTSPAHASGSHAGGHDDHAVGKPGKPEKANRTIEVTMTETDDGKMLYEPASMEFKKGETVRFVIKNAGETEHEFVLDTHAKNQEHKALMEKFPEMEHDDPNAIRLEEGATGEIVWTFSNTGTFEFACLIPGHYESGMHGDVTVAAK